MKSQANSSGCLISNSPLFSIILPTHNRPTTFLRAISSVARQTLRDLELIVIDDNSSTGYAKTYLDDFDLSYRLISNSSNQGAAASRNIGVRLARGKYIAFLDDDDEFKESFLETTHTFLKDSADEIGLSWCNVECVDYPRLADETPLIRTRVFKQTYASKEELIEQVLSIGTGFGVVVKSQCIKEVGLFDSRLQTGSDTDFFLKILKAGYLPIVIPHVCVVIHNHNDIRLTGRNLYQQRLINTKQIVRQHADFLCRYPLLAKKLDAHIASLESDASAIHFA